MVSAPLAEKRGNGDSTDSDDEVPLARLKNSKSIDEDDQSINAIRNMQNTRKIDLNPDNDLETHVGFKPCLKDVNLEELVLISETETKRETRKNITKTCEVREGHEIDNDDACEPVVNLRALSPLGLEFNSDCESFNDSDADPEFHPGVCEAQHCKKNM
ncbi:hypothetical protein PoB_003356100 [Plakobranchus ocellatus]|uniref:Uncharacterized protein n=1 Tax=Plakobranchus ocellatus TaxID=259542 RepID=A0AAV4AFH2_9GAST|nr:hypothetical protein PoB_003356100 [Plakobranchus ocellatus]